MKTFPNFIKLLSVTFLINFLLPAGAVIAQCNTSVVLTVPQSYQGSGFLGNGNFNAIIFGSLNAAGGDSEGRLAVGGNFNGPNSYSVGLATQGISAPVNTDNLIVNGKFTNKTNWGMRGNFVYNTLNAGSQLPSHEAGTGTNRGGVKDHLDFTGLKDYYTTLTTKLGNLPSNGTVSYSPWNYVEIELKGTNTNLNVFTVTLPEDKSFGIKINVPKNSSVLINVTNKTVIFVNGSMSGGERDKTLFNFPKATNISLTGYALDGQLLAPFANFKGNGGNINGQAVIGGDVDQINGFEFHNFCSTFPMPNLVPLPVTLTSFTVGKEGNHSVLNWKTSFETNSDHFEVQYSTNAKVWEAIGTVDAKGESKEQATYQFVHNSPVNGVNYYRLKMIDVDGTFAFSSIRDVAINAPEAVSVYPNPVIRDITLATQDWSKIKDIYLISMSGKKMPVPAHSDKIDLSSVSAGIYILQVNQINGAVSTTRIIKQ